jgi:hypothetical protein
LPDLSGRWDSNQEPPPAARVFGAASALLLAEILVGKVLDQLALAAPELYLLVEEELRQSVDYEATKEHW